MAESATGRLQYATDAHWPERRPVRTASATDRYGGRPMTDSRPERGQPAARPMATCHRALGLTDDECGTHRRDPGPRAQPPRAGHVRRDVERALLLQVLRGPPASACPPRRPRCWSAPARTPASSTPATASPWPSASRATTTPRPSSPTRARRPASGGILRDIFTMGARPIALMDPLFFGPPDDARSRWLVEGVVSRHLRLRQLRGRAHHRRRAHLRRPATPATRWSTCSASACCPSSAWCSSGAGRRQPRRAARLDHRPRRHRRRERAGLGRLRRRRGRRRPSARASRSATPSRRSASSRPAWSCSTRGLVVGIQDLGGAGLACATERDRGRGGVGMDVDVAAVPRREPGMEPFEVMTSESQERMLAIVDPGRPRRGARRSAAAGRSGPP